MMKSMKMNDFIFQLIKKKKFFVIIKKYVNIYKAININKNCF